MQNIAMKGKNYYIEFLFVKRLPSKSTSGTVAT